MSFKEGDTVRVLMGCIWQRVEIEKILPDDYYLCGTNTWSTYFHKSLIKPNIEMKTKKVTISLTEEQQQQAKEISKELLGKENISGLFAFWINQHLKKRSKPS